MPQLDPELVLDRFATIVREDVRPAITDEFAHAQAGSMASTLQFLAGEVGGREASVRTQARVLSERLTELEATLERNDIDSTAVRAAIDDARAQLDAGDRATHEFETTLLEAADDVLGTIDEELDAEHAAIARRPLYGFLRTRVDEQLRLLGREESE
jgi:hypothetical protein